MILFRKAFYFFIKGEYCGRDYIQFNCSMIKQRLMFYQRTKIIIFGDYCVAAFVQQKVELEQV